MTAHAKALVPLLLLVFGVTGGPAEASEFASVYTRHDFQNCAARPSPEPDVSDVRVCRGYAGIEVVWSAEPDSSSVAFGKMAAAAAIPGLEIFHEPRGTVEWRGPSVGRSVRPVAAILRYDTGPAVGRMASSRLVVYRLAPGGPSCVMGVIKGVPVDANKAARALVDRRASGFVCGKSETAGGS